MQPFFEAINEKYHLKPEIAPEKRAINDHQKHLIMKVFARLVGSSDGAEGMFDSTVHGLRDGKTEEGGYDLSQFFA